MDEPEHRAQRVALTRARGSTAIRASAWSAGIERLTTIGFHHHPQCNELDGGEHDENAGNTQKVLAIAPMGEAWLDEAHHLHDHSR
ncbi:MAG: hypothetical protein ACRENW_08855 [Thermodesulfobacteriota bacterium]